MNWIKHQSTILLQISLRSFLLLLGLSLSSPVFAQTWTGNSSPSWNLASNWNPAAVPNINSNVTIPNTTIKPIITAGTAAVAKSVNVQAGGMLTVISGGSLTMSGATANALTNAGTINFNANSSLTINGAASNGISNSGTFTNRATVILGGTNQIGGIGIQNSGIFNHLAGSITINRTTSHGINNQLGTFTNKATITLGSTNLIFGVGIQNFANFINDVGTINIHRTNLDGIVNMSGTFTNKAVININSTTNTSTLLDGIDNRAVFNNDPTGTIKIDKTSINARAIVNSSTGNFTNKGNITMGGLGNINGHGIENFASFTNESGTIKVDRTTNNGNGIYNHSGTFINKAMIAIGSVAGINANGILNEAVFNNLVGTIGIDRTGIQGIDNLVGGNFTNKAIINIGGLASTIIGSSGIYNKAIFTNETGSININRTTQNGIFNFPGTFTNKAIITIGNNANIGGVGIQNSATFINQSGSIGINRTSYDGIVNQITSTFLNQATIVIGTLAGTNIGANGINSDGTFNNQNGSIAIDRTIQSGIYCNGGIFTNNASIAIGSNAIINGIGIFNRGNFTNIIGSISIDRTALSGILNNSPGAFTNKATISIGTLASNIGDGIYNASGFINDVCALLTLWDNSFNSASFTNRGLFSVNTTQPHINTGSFINDGIIEYPQGNPIPNVTNNDIIVAPVAGCPSPTSLQPALELGGAVSFTVGSTWYSNPSLSTPAGTYSQATNTFTFSPPLGIGTYTLYMSINGTPSCPRTVAIQVKLEDNVPPVPVCMINTVFVDSTLCLYTILPSDVLAGATDNCGIVNIVSISPSTLTCADIGNIISVTVIVDDGHGNTASCTSMLTVMRLFRNPNISSSFMMGTSSDGDAENSYEQIQRELPKHRSPFKPQQVEIFPNPTMGELTLRFKGTAYNACTIQFLDLLGRTLRTETLQPSQLQHQIPMDAMPSGVYFVMVLDKGEPIWIEKVVKQ